MINASELRKDNIVMRLNKFDRLPRVTKIIGMMIFQAEKEPEEFDAIPLTAEWLERLGFEVKAGEPTQMIICRRAFNLYKNLIRDGSGRYKGYSLCMKTEDGMTAHVFVEYVHQLQNLYFALTGKELEVKI